MKSPDLPPFNYTPKPFTGPSVEEVLALRNEFVNPAVFLFYQKPMMIVEGKGQYLFDEKGRRYLDGFAGIATVSVGHCHPDVVAAANLQNETLQHASTIYLHPNIALYARDLAAKMPGNLKVCYFVNSGSEATDLAILMARAFTGNHDVIALRNGYHGGNATAMALTALRTWKFNIPQNFGVHHAIAPYPYRGAFAHDYTEAGKAYADDVRDLIQHATSGQIAAFIAESIQGVGGTILFPEGYLKHVYQHVRAAGGVCIADEVQTGFGRTGETYWGFEGHDAMPDIVTMAKGIGNGVPLAAVVTTPQIAKSLAARIHFNTFGGNPVCCAQGRAVLQVIDREKLQQNALQVGNYLLAGFHGLAKKHNLIGEIRGKGLMLGIELVKDRITKEPAKEECARVHEMARDLGLLVGKGGLFANTLRIKPPMCLTQADADFMIGVLDASFSTV
jgi:alanine-glyoxylate transaminase / (R)-3-amino-2-methylpropionate-pyruvate transaminase